MIGCAYDAKKGANLNYLPRAVDAGADVYTDVRIERIAPRSGGGFLASGFVVARGCARRASASKCRRSASCSAAGAVHSPAILDASGLARDLPALGRNVSLQPQLPVAALFPEDVDVVAWRGSRSRPTATIFDSNTAEQGLGGFRFEPLSVGVAQLASNLGGFGADHKALMAQLRHAAMALLLVPDAPSGRLAWTRGERGFAASIEYTLTEEWTQRLRSGLRAVAEAYFEAGGVRGAAGERRLRAVARTRGSRSRGVVPAAQRRHAPDRADVQGQLPDGRFRTAASWISSTRVHGVRGFGTVVDASVFPTSASTHTMIPVMTFGGSRRAADARAARSRGTCDRGRPPADPLAGEVLEGPSGHAGR